MLRALREARGLTLQRFSEQFPGRGGHGIDPADLNRFENGRREVGVRRAAAIERALGLPAGSLIAPAVRDAAGPEAALTHAILRRFVETAPRDHLEELRARVEKRLRDA
jgi:transcriptional regulator with XRE-family HTH domain